MSEEQIVVEFEVEAVFSIAGRGAFVGARLLNGKSTFRLSTGATLGERPIETWLNMPRKLDPEGNQRLDYYVFKLQRTEDLAAFETGECTVLRTRR